MDGAAESDEGGLPAAEVPMALTLEGTAGSLTSLDAAVESTDDRLLISQGMPKVCNRRKVEGFLKSASWLTLETRARCVRYVSNFNKPIRVPGITREQENEYRRAIRCACYRPIAKEDANRYLKCKFTTLSRMLYDEWKGCRDWTPPEMVYPRSSSEPSFDVSSFDVSSFDVSSFDVSSFDVSSFDVSSFDVSSFDVSSFDVSSFEPPADHFQPQLPQALAPSRRFTSVAAGAGIGMVAGLGMVVGLLALRRGRKRVR